MTYPRMNKSDYPPMPEVINTEAEYDLVLEYIVYLAIQIENLQNKKVYPLATDEEKEDERIKNLRIIGLTMNKYDQLCLLIDDYKRRNPHFAHQAAVAHLSR